MELKRSQNIWKGIEFPGPMMVFIWSERSGPYKNHPKCRAPPKKCREASTTKKCHKAAPLKNAAKNAASKYAVNAALLKNAVKQLSRKCHAMSK